MVVRRAAAVVGAVAATVALSAPPALARLDADIEMPFSCNQEWTGTSRSSHSPSSHSIDWNRPDDRGKRAVASAAGVVTRVEDLGSRSYGKYIVVDHGNGDTSLYAHLDAQWVQAGQRVDQGSVLGLVGTSGGSSGPHLHFEERLNNRVQKPWFHQVEYVMPKSRAFSSRVSTCRRDTGSAMPCERSVVGTLWSTTARLAETRQGLRPASLSPSKACGLVTSWTRWRST